MMLGDALRYEEKGIVDVQPKLTEDEFVLRVLKDFGLVDENLVTSV